MWPTGPRWSGGSYGDRQYYDAGGRGRRVENIAEARNIVRESFPLDEYHPRNVQAWNDAYSRFMDVLDAEV